MTVDQIKELRAKLPDTWRWKKCYELSYISFRTGREFIKKHWALQAPDGKGIVYSLGLISHDATSTKEEFYKNDVPVQFVEQSLEIIDTLLAEIETLKADKIAFAKHHCEEQVKAIEGGYDNSDKEKGYSTIEKLAIRNASKTYIDNIK